MRIELLIEQIERKLASEQFIQHAPTEIIIAEIQELSRLYRQLIED